MVAVLCCVRQHCTSALDSALESHCAGADVHILISSTFGWVIELLQIFVMLMSVAGMPRHVGQSQDLLMCAARDDFIMQGKNVLQTLDALVFCRHCEYSVKLL